jgi:hypothetical protein
MSKPVTLSASDLTTRVERSFTAAGKAVKK